MADQVRDQIRGAGDRRRVSGAVGEKNAGIAPADDLLRRDSGRHHRDGKAFVNQASKDGPFDAEVDDRHTSRLVALG